MTSRVLRLAAATALAVASVSVSAAVAQSAPADTADPASRAREVASHWTPDRRAEAIPRDLALDAGGAAYLRTPDGGLTPYGHDVAAAVRAEPAGGNTSGPVPQAAPPADTEAPTVSDLVPAAGATIGGSHAFSASVTDASGVKAVTFEIRYPDGGTGTFAASTSGGDTWSVTLSGFSDGEWAWRVIAQDRARRGGNTTTTPYSPFTVDVGGGSEPPAGVVTNSDWAGGGEVQDVAGRIYFEMPANRSGRTWNGYVCSGTVSTDAAGEVSVVLTAAHCVYDDVTKTFARNVLFIPDQAHTTGTGTDTSCDNDPYGCWAPSHGVVDVEWTTRTFPDNIPWDYAYYVVPAAGAHIGAGEDGAVESVVGSLPVDFAPPVVDAADGSDLTHALGYSYSDDPNFMYCAEDMTTEGAANWWLPSCGLSGGSSGGPWIQPMDASAGAGPLISVNSWGYTDRPGMAGPKLSGTSAQCLFGLAEGNTTTTARGAVGTC